MSNRRADPTDDPFDPLAVVDQAEALPDRWLLFAPPKWGKTSFAAQIPGAVFLMSKGEDGILTLKKSGQVGPDVKHYPCCAENWRDATRAVSALAVKADEARARGMQALVLDTLNGFQQLLFDYLCQTEFGNSWTEFGRWAQGPKASVGEWSRFLDALDSVRRNGFEIWCLCHATVASVKNPRGPDYDHFQPEIDPKYLWPITSKWADTTLFGHLETTVSQTKQEVKAGATKGKAVGGEHRVIQCQPSAAWEAGSRYALPEEIDCGTSAAEAWANFQAALYPSE